jgi:translocation and assembly module TamB
MSAPTPANDNTATTAAVAGRKRSRNRWWLLLWVPGVLMGLVLAAGVALWVWAATPGSLAQTLAWAQNWTKQRTESVGTLDIQQVQGSCATEGTLAT